MIMSQTADFSKLAKMAEEILQGKEFFVSTVLDRVKEAVASYPHDQAIRMAGTVLQKRAAKQGSLATITQKEFQGIYDEVAGLGDRAVFAEHLGEFLMRKAAPVASYNADFAAGLRDSGSELDIVNPDMAEQLAGLFSEAQSAPRKGSFIDNGRKGLELELASLGFANASVEVAAKGPDFVIYATEINSTHGRIPAYIPAEIKLGTVLMPSVFVSGNDFVELTHDNLLAHAQAVAMGKKTASASQILGALSSIAQVQDQLVVEASDEGAFDAMLASPSLYQGQIESTTPDMIHVAQPDAEMPAELEHLTEGTVRDALIEAGLSFDRNTVLAAKSLVASEIRSMGVQLDKVAVDSEFDGGIMLAANIRGSAGKKTIQVPVEVTAGRVLMPSVFTSGAVVESFDAKALQSFANEKAEGIFNAAFSDKIGWNFKQLHNHALKSAAFGNFVEAEEALAVINEQFGPDFHKAAFEDLVGLLNVGIAEEEKPLDAMDKYVKEASARANDKENNVKMSGTLMYLYAKD
jgi:hypothetical protein